MFSGKRWRIVNNKEHTQINKETLNLTIEKNVQWSLFTEENSKWLPKCKIVNLTRNAKMSTHT